MADPLDEFNEDGIYIGKDPASSGSAEQGSYRKKQLLKNIVIMLQSFHH